MIRQDYLLRMIQEIIAVIVEALLMKKKFRKQEWAEYDDLTGQILGLPTEQLGTIDVPELIGRYEGDPDRMGKIELAAMTMLKVADESEPGIVEKSKLRQDGLALLHYVQNESGTFSLPRKTLIDLLEMNG